jgi:hypothetical protein
MRDLLMLMVITATSAALVAVSYAALLAATGFLATSDVVAAALQFWVGDMIGIAVISNFGLILLTRGSFLRMSGETLAQIIAILAALGIVFASAEKQHFQLFYLLFLPVIWMAVRGGSGSRYGRRLAYASGIDPRLATHSEGVRRRHRVSSADARSDVDGVDRGSLRNAAPTHRISTAATPGCGCAKSGRARAHGDAAQAEIVSMGQSAVA